MNEAISFGSGINSVAMTILLVQQGWRGLIGFADTLSEKPGTYCYLDYFESHFLKQHGLEIIRLKPGSSYHCSMSQVGLEAYCLQAGVIPLLAVRWCSSRWKGRPLDRWAKENGVIAQYIGFSAEEAGRANGKLDHQRFPLISEGVNREGCRQIILDAGLETPPYSACFFCPGQTIGEWRRLYYEHLDLFERAQALEANASQRYDKVAV
jgi:hypothetical protein